MFALAERGAAVRVESADGGVLVRGAGHEVLLSPQMFVEATVGRLPGGAVPAELAAVLRVLA